jgi:hypothetical protein
MVAWGRFEVRNVVLARSGESRIAHQSALTLQAFLDVLQRFKEGQNLL